VKTHRALRADAVRIWTAALRSVDSEAAVRRSITRDGHLLQINGCRFDLGKARKVWILGAGKAAASMGQAVEKILGPCISGGILVTKYDHSLPLKKLEIFEAGHPLPDANSIAAATRMTAFAKDRIESDDIVLCLLSGGASSLLASPAEGITLEDKLACTQLLLKGGADIHDLNAVRKHLSNLKGGGLARLLAPAKSISLILSDVVGDDVSTIASGLMAPDPTTFADCIDIFNKLGLLDQMPSAVKLRFEQGAAGRIEETPKPDDPAFQKSKYILIGNNAQACTAAVKTARRLGYRAMILTSRLQGDNREAAQFHMSIANEIVFERRPLQRPACIISGGETTAIVVGEGKGGRNQEFVLNCVRQLACLPAPCLVASLGTDGTDGPTEAAGAVADNTSLARSMKYGAYFLNKSLAHNDSNKFFEQLGDLIVTGPTQTNVMDLHIVMVG
jgi:glycerate 2-kinase